MTTTPAYGPMLIDRVPSSDTPRVQLAVAIYVIYGLVVGLVTQLGFGAEQVRRQVAVQAARQAQINPNLPPNFQDSAVAIGTTFLYFAAGFGVVLSLLLLAGTWQRWRWIYYLQMVLGLLGTFSLIQTPIGLARGTIFLPVPLVVLGMLGSVAAIGLTVWMFILWRRYSSAWAIQEVTRPIG